VSSVAAPDAVGAIVGWRAWTIAQIDGRFRLRSMVAPTLWEPLQVFEATCLRPRLRLFRRWSARHEAPWTGCQCGIYATDSVTAATYASGPAYGAERRVLGTVALWGLVAECEHGWRASDAYPCQIMIPEHRFAEESSMPLEAVALDLMDYGVPVTLVGETELDELLREGHQAPA
jgi:hypothetical protein